MIQYTCIKCGAANSAHDSQAGQGVVCPQCGNMNIVPATAGAGAAPPPAATPVSPAMPAAAPMTPEQVNQWAMVCHLAALAGFMIPFGNIVGPLVVWLLKGKEHPFIDANGKASLNFQITLAIAYVVCVPLMFLLVGIPLMIALGIYGLIMVIIASVRASRGVQYKYPVSLSLVK
jgi:uncharacterized Tic20 family protein/DNA-directed RNA polymerase subunit RPC12/RpoP